MVELGGFMVVQLSQFLNLDIGFRAIKMMAISIVSNYNSDICYCCCCCTEVSHLHSPVISIWQRSPNNILCILDYRML